MNSVKAWLKTTKKHSFGIKKQLSREMLLLKAIWVICMIMAGVTIGDYCQISPGVVVSKNIKSRTIVAPAVLRYFHTEQ